MQAYIGMRLGGYQIVEQIGQGGMATVFKAYQPSMDRYVAIKVLPSHLSEDKTFLGRFDQEARTLARLEHPHILPVHDYGEQDGVTYLVMRYVGTGTLREVIARRGALEVKEAARIIDQVGRALDYAHSQGVLHRDIKPSNVLIDQRGDTFLTDFGIAKLMAETTAKFTATSAIIGTPAYMAPEQALGEPVDHRCDIYALGVMLYELLTGKVPYEAETPLAVVLKHINDPLPVPRHLRPDVPEAVERVVLKAMAKKPADRFSTPGDMVETLNRAVAALTAEAAAPGLPELQPTLVKKEAPPPARPPAEAEPEVSAAGAPPTAAAAALQPRAIPGPAEPAALPQAVPAAPARRRRPWLAIALAAAGLLAVLVVAVLLLGNGNGDGTQAAATLPPAATMTQALPAGGPPAATTQTLVTVEAAPTLTEGAAPTATSPVAAPTLAPALALHEPGWTSFTNTDLALAVARQGETLWVGSEGGLVRWDLNAGTYTRLGIADGLPSGRINDLLVDASGTLWAATAAGLARFDGQTWTTFDQADGLDSGWVETLLLDGNGALWAGTADGDRGLNYYDGSGWGPPPIPPLPVDWPIVTALAGNPTGSLFVGLVDEGLARFDGVDWTLLGSKDGLPGDRVWDLALAGSALWAAFDDGLVRFDLAAGDWTKMQETSLYAMFATQEGTLWFGGGESVLRFEPDTGDWQVFDAPDVPIGRFVTDIRQEKDGFWFATYGQGAVRYDGQAWTSWMTGDAIGGNIIEAIREGKDGSVWVTHPGTGLSRYDPSRATWQSFGETEGALDWPSAPGVDSQGNLWIARDGLLVRYDGRGWQAFPAEELRDIGVYTIAIGPGDVQWLKTDAGLMRHDPVTGWTRFSDEGHPLLAEVEVLLATSDGSVWAGGEQGIVRYDGKAWTEPEGGGEELVYVTGAAEAPDGSVWLAADGSLYHLVGDNQYVYHWPSEGWVEHLAVAPDGSVWAGHEGVGRLNPADSTWQIFGPGNGLVDPRVTDICVTADGVVWVGTEGGISRYLPPQP